MDIFEIDGRTPRLMAQLLEVWERSVRATHLFLSDAELARIKVFVPTALRDVPHLVTAERESGRPVAFLGADGHRLEMLFLSPEERGRGLGRALLTYAIQRYGVNELTVNEQNPEAVGFYAHMGFHVYQRTEQDGQGAPYPLLYMRTRRPPPNEKG